MGQIAGPGSFVRVACEMEMGVDHPGDVARKKSRRGKRVFQLRRPLKALILDAINIEKLCILLVAQRGVDEDQPRVMLDQQAAHGHWNAVPLIRLESGLPQHTWHHAEHGTSIEPLHSALESMAAKSADL